jgi:hypothetical protein
VIPIYVNYFSTEKICKFYEVVKKPIVSTVKRENDNQKVEIIIKKTGNEFIKTKIYPSEDSTKINITLDSLYNIRFDKRIIFLGKNALGIFTYKQ